MNKFNDLSPFIFSHIKICMKKHFSSLCLSIFLLTLGLFGTSHAQTVIKLVDVLAGLTSVGGLRKIRNEKTLFS